MKKPFLITVVLAVCVAAGLTLLDRKRDQTAQPDIKMSRQKLGLRLTGMGKVASIELPLARANTEAEYIFNRKFDVREPIGKDLTEIQDVMKEASLPTYTTAFKEDLFSDLEKDGAFIDDVTFWVTEVPPKACADRAKPRVAKAKEFFSETTVEQVELGGRKWNLITELWRLANSGVNRVTYTFCTPLPETDSCACLNTRFAERIAPAPAADISGYKKYDPSPRAQAANVRMRARILDFTRHAAQTFSIETGVSPKTERQDADKD